MTSIAKPKVPLEVVEAKLAKDDDRDFWQAALAVRTDEFLQRYDRESKGRIWIFSVGAEGLKQLFTPTRLERDSGLPKS
jgi:hypothetical protein